MDPTDALAALAPLFEIAFVGRVILALLPPGLPGRHRFGELPATWAASHLLGGIALGLESRLLELLELDPPRLALVAPWLLVALARWITLPGAMVPRHEPLPEGAGALAKILRIAAPLAVALATWHHRMPLAAAADALALLACASFALLSSRRSPTGRALVVLLLALVLGLGLDAQAIQPIAVALRTGAGACFSAVWLRRGDRRAALLAVIAFAGCGLLGLREALLGCAGLIALWIHTPGPSQRWVLERSVVALAVGAAAGWSVYDPFAPGAEVVNPLTEAVLVVVALAVWRRKRLVDARAPAEGAQKERRGRIDPTIVERELVRDAVILCLFPMAARGELSAFERLAPALLPLAPLVLLELGLVLAPAEQPPGTAVPAPGPARR
jgi:hypothetical protein